MAGVDVAVASSPATAGRLNEDFVGVAGDAIVLLDGAGIRGAESICRHGVFWYTRQLGGAILRRLSDGSDRTLTDIVAEAIDEVSGKHRHTCDIANPSSPQATVAALRIGGGRLDYLVLADCYLVMDRHGGEPQVLTDEREVAVRRAHATILDGVTKDSPEYSLALDSYIEALRTRRNQQGGYWIAKDDPRASFEALSGNLPTAGLRGAALLSNGASRFVDPYGLAGWPETLALLRSADGPRQLIRRLRAAEVDGPSGSPARSDNPPDDASAAYGWFAQLDVDSFQSL